MLLPHEPRPTDLVCPVCGEPVRYRYGRARSGRSFVTGFACQGGHDSGRQPIDAAAWCAQAASAKEPA